MKKLQQLQPETKDIISDPPPLGASDRHLLQLQDVDKKKGRQLHRLLQAICAATKKEELQYKCKERVQIVEYMTAVQRRQQSAALRVLW